MPSPPANILLLGLAKTGSTVLYHVVKDALAQTPHDYYCLFEPTRPDQLDNLYRYAPSVPVLTKVMIAREPDLQLSYERFGARATMVRDPRDMLVRFLLFRPFIRADVPWEQIEPFVEALRAKEKDPPSWSIEALHGLADDLGLASYRLDRVIEFMRWQEALIDRRGVFTVRYERFIAGDVDDLSDYLGMPVGGMASDASWRDHAVRSGGAGDWRHWFTADDVAVYRPSIARYMARFGYDDEWELAADPAIASASASGYVEDKHRARRTQQRQRRTGLTTDPATPGHRARVEQLASDGNAQAMYRLAKAGVGNGADPHGVFRLAYRAAVQGHRPAMRLLGELYVHGRGVEPDDRQAAFWAAEGGGRDARPSGLRRLLRRR